MAGSNHLLTEQVIILHPTLTPDGMGGHSEAFVPEKNARGARLQALAASAEQIFAGAIQGDEFTQIWVEPYPSVVIEDDRARLDSGDWEIIVIVNMGGFQRLSCKKIQREA